MTAAGPSRFSELTWHSALELMLTSVLLFGVTTVVRFVVGPSPISRAFPQIHVELLIVGAAVGGLLTGLIKSPGGRISGGGKKPPLFLPFWGVGGVFSARGLPFLLAPLVCFVFWGGGRPGGFGG